MKFPGFARFTLLFAAVAVLSACQVLGVPQAKTFSERLAAGYTSVTTLRDTAAVLLRADKISSADAQNIQTSANTARDGLDIARDLYLVRPQAAEDRLVATIRILETAQRYVDKRAKE